MIKSLLDGLDPIKEQICGSDCEPSVTGLMVIGVHVRHGLAIIGKGRNTQQEVPSEWLGGRLTIKVVPDR